MATVPELLTVTEAATALGLSRRAVLHRIQAGTLDAIKLGTGKTSAYVLTADEVERAKVTEIAS